jgi:ABC-type glycerol-3-phosphate transport system substrate-binding protein
MVVAQSSQHQEAAIAFIEWYAEVFDPIFSKGSGMLSPFVGGDGPVWGDFIDLYPNPRLVERVPQNEDAVQVFNYSGIDFTKALQDILLGRSVEDVAAELNTQWQAGLASLG